MTTHYKKPFRLAVLALAGTLCTAAFATEGGGSTYPLGTENFMAGAAPPPGLYVLEYLNYYTTSRVNDGQGNAVPIPGFKVRAAAAATRLIWITPQEALGGLVAAHAILPVVDLSVRAGGANDSRTGLGDVTVGGSVAWHHSPQLHSVVGLDAVLPTGAYDRTRQANIGRNYLSLQPLGVLTWMDPSGFNGDVKATLNFNRTNGDTNYRSGRELIVDYAAGWGLGNGWVVGVGGYVYRQWSDDKVGGVALAGSRGRSQSIGPSVRYANGKGWLITAKVEKEFGVRNRAQGSQFWLKTTIPF
ncbi:transporter [Acidovorax sp. A79]|uniref:SphA family protein n=1 Tax=Acidovorax sp. A79 TaxID=3056107 RepID=UPI0034E83E4C